MNKFERADRVINILGEDQKLGMMHLGIALDILGVGKQPEVIFYSFVSLPEGRMSTRKGRVVYLDDLVEEAEERALEEVKKRRNDISEEKMKEIARTIGRGAVRFNIVRVQPEKQLMFRWEDALNFEGNSAPFVQYSYARACSILRKAGNFTMSADLSVLMNEYEIQIDQSTRQVPRCYKGGGGEGKDTCARSLRA